MASSHCNVTIRIATSAPRPFTASQREGLGEGADGKRTGSEMSSGEDEGAVLWRQCAITDRYQARQMALVHNSVRKVTSLCGYLKNGAFENCTDVIHGDMQGLPKRTQPKTVSQLCRKESQTYENCTDMIRGDAQSLSEEAIIKLRTTWRAVTSHLRTLTAHIRSKCHPTRVEQDAYFMERERGKVVVYLTTLGIVRDTYERCLRIRKILWTLLVRFEERDVFMARDTQLQLLDRLHSSHVSVPHVFLEGQYLGDAEQIERLNECGELRRLLQPYRRACQVSPCDTCGGFRLLPCSVCNGSKKSVHRNDFTLEFVALKCSSCDESGLVRCVECDEDKDGLERPA
ncbi:hypothetical protein O3P69_007089 [Scylla paramamosain]|uniref:Glutaredoxin domain-containing protein n=1 Tax=Scylla paramamosain TaxID=85552 RepID=A0AAW0V2F7_SCYPA